MSPMRSFTIFCRFFAFGLLTGCVASNPVQRGDVARYANENWIPPSRLERNTPLLPCEAVIREEWAEHSGPWAIADLLDIALKNNPLTHESWQSAKAAAYTWKSTQSDLYPSIGLSEELLLVKVAGSRVGNIASDTSSTNSVVDLSAGGAASTAASGTTVSSTAFTYNQWIFSTLSLSYLLMDFGGRLSSVESARQALLVANWTHNRTIQSVILSVLTNYYQHLEANALFAAKLEDIKNAEENLKAAEGQFAAGVKAKLDVLLAKSNLTNTQLDLEKLRGTVSTTLGQLATSLGLPANAIFEVKDLPEEKDTQKIHQNIEELVAIAKLQRPDLASAEANWKASREDIITAWSSGMPTLTANASAQVSNNIHHSIFNSRQYTGFLMVNVPLFTGYYYVNQTRRAQALSKLALASWKEQEENVILDVVTSYYDYKTAIETVKFSDDYYTYTLEAYDVAFASYKSGVSTILDLLAAQSALSNARAQKIQARTQWVTSLANVAYATGQL